jgi:ABC-type proline/glycine betaine transport system substrate-binding protein
MESIFELLSEVQGYVILSLMVLVLILIVLVIVLFSSINSLEKRYRKFMRGVNNKNLEELVMTYLDKVDEATRVSQSTKDLYEEMDIRLKGCIQNTSIIRYKAFEDVGSDLSFSIALLDDNSDGVIITGIYGRNDSTTYAKPIDKGISRYDLSEEEQHVLRDAMIKEVNNKKK